MIVDVYIHTIKSVDDEYDHYRDFEVAWILILCVCVCMRACMRVCVRACVCVD